jgi:CheY-like chemotaxis protein
MQPIVKPEQKIDRPLRVLIVEDAKSDITLLLLALREGGFEVTYKAVTTQAAMRVALLHHKWDLITSDHGITPGKDSCWIVTLRPELCGLSFHREVAF